MVVLIGAANLDVLGFTKDPLILKDSNPGHVRLCIGGVSRNIGENLTRIGLDTELITAVGSGIDGTFILSNCREIGIGTAYAAVVGNRPSSIYIALMDHDGDMALALSDMTISETIIPEFLRERRAVLDQASAIVADTCLPLETLEYLTDTIKNKPLCIDTVSVHKGEKLKPILGKIDTLKMNLLEAEHISGISSSEPDSQRKMGDHFLNLGTRQIIITSGGGGSAWFSSQEACSFIPPEVIPVNTTGAGDAFMAGVVYSRLHNYTGDDTLLYSSALAAIALESEETVNPALSLELVNERAEKIQEYLN